MSPLRASRCVERGLTLIELLVTITVLALAGVALMGTMGYLAGKSGDSLAQTQAQAIADAYLASTLARSFPSITGGTAMQGSMQVAIAVTGSGALPGVLATAATRVDVTVTAPSGQTAIATGYRLPFP